MSKSFKGGKGDVRITTEEERVYMIFSSQWHFKLRSKASALSKGNQPYFLRG